MSNIDDFMAAMELDKEKSESEFIPNPYTVWRMEKEKPENRLEPDINDIQRFTLKK